MKISLFLIGILVAALALNSVIAEPVSYTSTGIELDTFPTDLSVYVKYDFKVYCGGEVLENEALTVYIVEDKDWTYGNIIEGIIKTTTITTGDDGKFPPSMIWETPETGSYDIIIDVNKNGIYDTAGECSDFIDGRLETGFNVIEATTPETVEENTNTTVVEETNVTTEENVTIEENITVEPETTIVEETEEVVDEEVEEIAEPQTIATTEDTVDKEGLDYVPLIIIIGAVMIAVLIIVITLIRMR